MKRALSIIAGAGMLLAGSLLTANAAMADTPTYPYQVTQDWYAPTPATVANPFAVPQTTKVLTCGGIKQHDGYTIKTAEMATHYQALIAGGVLKSGAGDAEFSPHGYTVTALPACAPALANMITTSNTLKCNVATITLENRSPWIYPVSVETDGVHSYGPTVDNRTNGTLSGPQKDASATRTITFADNTGDHTVAYRVDAGSERDLYTGLAVGNWTTLTVHTNQSTDAKAACYVAPTVVTPPVKAPPVVTPPKTVTPPPAVTTPKVVTPPAARHTTFVPQAQHFEANTGVEHASIFPSWMVWSAFSVMLAITLILGTFALRANKGTE